MTRFPALAGTLLAAVVVAACSDKATLGPHPDQPQALWFDPVGALLSCSPLPAESATQTIGPEGGTIFVGPHKVRVPEGALAEPARLTLSYANCGAVSWLLPKRIAYTTDDLLTIIELLISFDNVLARRVSADLDHFSTYAVAW